MASTKEMKHETRENLGDCGENLAMSSEVDKMLTTDEAVKMWYNELYKPGYNFEAPGL